MHVWVFARVYERSEEVKKRRSEEEKEEEEDDDEGNNTETERDINRENRAKKQNGVSRVICLQKYGNQQQQ